MVQPVLPVLRYHFSWIVDKVWVSLGGALFFVVVAILVALAAFVYNILTLGDSIPWTSDCKTECKPFKIAQFWYLIGQITSNNLVCFLYHLGPVHFVVVFNYGKPFRYIA